METLKTHVRTRERGHAWESLVSERCRCVRFKRGGVSCECVTEGERERTMRCFDISSRRLRKVRDDDEPGRLTALSLYDY